MNPTVEFINPPIPDRQFDWCAYFDAEDGVYGYGATKERAIANLFEQVDLEKAQ